MLSCTCATLQPKPRPHRRFSCTRNASWPLLIVSHNLKKIQVCSVCQKSFWYLDPRPGGRPRNKCGICSSRPPRYPWDFVDPHEKNTPKTNHSSSPPIVASPPPTKPSTSTAPLSLSSSTPPSFTTASLVTTNYPATHIRPLRSSAEEHHPTWLFAEDSLPQEKESPIMQSNAAMQSPSRRSKTLPPQDNTRLDEMDARLSLIESRLEQIEQRLEQLNQSSISRSEWIDISARLDIVEKNSNETIHKIRQRLDGFTKEVRQIAVVPERELQEMHSLMHSIRAFLQPDVSTPPLRSGRSGNR